MWRVNIHYKTNIAWAEWLTFAKPVIRTRQEATTHSSSQMKNVLSFPKTSQPKQSFQKLHSQRFHVEILQLAIATCQIAATSVQHLELRRAQIAIEHKPLLRNKMTLSPSIVPALYQKQWFAIFDATPCSTGKRQATQSSTGLRNNGLWN